MSRRRSTPGTHSSLQATLYSIEANTRTPAESPTAATCGDGFPSPTGCGGIGHHPGHQPPPHPHHDRVVVLHEGRIIEDGTPAEVSNSDVVREAYLGTVA
ncbi:MULTISPECIES: hypothetical protein [unclassified Streptomyces]|uniref:ABC transporter ATP-binding protein C-terminal domain-containing protein n=1 Tax=unclassified Streptomyces TaxID=2593676 RepID=UPI0033FAF4FD